MLVLTRKIDEQIVIGDDIKITLIRVRGNTVRLGIEAPRDVRIIRSELELSDEPSSEDDQTTVQRQDAFAHPRTKVASPNKTQISTERPTVDRSMAIPEASRPTKNRIKTAITPSVYVGKVARDGTQPELKRAPLASFVSVG